MSLDLNTIKAQLQNKLPETLKYLLPRGTFHKNKFYVGDIRGNEGKSLVVELSGNKAGQWHDFATKQGGDILSLWAFVKRIEHFPCVIASVEEWLGIQSEAVNTPIAPLKNLGGYTQKWDYRDKNNNVIVTVYRYDTSDGKEYRPYDHKASKSQAPEIRPPYNIPGILNSSEVVLVEGEKAAQSLIDIGICATTAMNGANSPILKTDWSILRGKSIIVWPDNDEPGQLFSKRVIQHLTKMKIDSIYQVVIPEDKPEKWDAADAVLEEMDIKIFLKRRILIYKRTFALYKMNHALEKTTPPPEDLIAPRILTPHSLLVFGGAPKIGKTDLLLSWLTHMAAGVPFLGMRPSRPLKIVYLQAEVGYDYMCERLRDIQINSNALPLAKENFLFSPQLEIEFNSDGVEISCRSILDHFPNHDIDIIVIDPLRNFLCVQENSENDNKMMLDFLRKKLGYLRDSINPDAGVILVHHTKKISSSDLKDSQFQALAGASSLRGYYSTGVLMWQPDHNKNEIQLSFELRNGKNISPKMISKIDGKWCEIEGNSLKNKLISQGNERQGQFDEIIEIIRKQARNRRIYTINQFCEEFENKLEFDSSRNTIRDRINTLCKIGNIKFFNNAEQYGLINPARTKYGYLCVDNMEVPMHDQCGSLKVVCPSHFMNAENGMLLPIENHN